MITVPHDCPRKRKDCISLAIIEADDKSSFFCCGENNGEHRPVAQDKYTTCFKGEFRDELNYSDKRDLVHQSAVIIQALAAIEKAEVDDVDWSPWVSVENVKHDE